MLCNIFKSFFIFCQPSHSHVHTNYRADIDGLRAIAVLSVVAFHAFPNYIKGGFIGVDVFFVISGYLISTIIYTKLTNGSFSIWEFYSRRVKRIFPSLLTVLTACYIFGWFALIADEFKQLGKHIMAGSAFISNFILWNEAGYFDNSADTKPLLHLWSLGIEEQFYIFWPLLLWFAWKRKFNILNITVLLMLISLILNLLGIKQDGVATFYSPQTRFWELLSGNLLSWIVLYKKDAFISFKIKVACWLTPIGENRNTKFNEQKFRNLTSCMGLLLLAYGFLQINKDFNFPGKWAILPVLGTVLIIYAGSDAWINRTLLSNKLVVWFGVISFPLYLWHWPLLSFARIVESEVTSSKIRIVIVLLSIFLAWLTYLLIENPIRFGKPIKLKVIMLILLMSLIGAIGYQTYTKDGLIFRNAAKTVSINRFDWPYKESCKKLTGEVYSDDWCNSGVTTSGENVTTVMIGDSFANAYSPMLKKYSQLLGNQFSFVQFARGQCPSLLGYGPSYCHVFAQKSFEYVKNHNNVKQVIIAANWPNYYIGKDFNWVKHVESTKAFRIAIKKTILAYKKINKEVVIFLPPPVGSSPMSCIVRPLRLTNKNICNLSVEVARANDGAYRADLLLLLKKLNIAYFDPFPVLCDDIACKIVDGNKILSSDGNHLSIYGGEYLALKGRYDLSRTLENKKNVMVTKQAG